MIFQGKGGAARCEVLRAGWNDAAGPPASSSCARHGAVVRGRVRTWAGLPSEAASGFVRARRHIEAVATLRTGSLSSRGDHTIQRWAEAVVAPGSVGRKHHADTSRNRCTNSDCDH